MKKSILIILILLNIACSEIKKSAKNPTQSEGLKVIATDSLSADSFVNQDSIWAKTFLADSITEVDVDDLIFDNESFTGCVDWNYPEEDEMVKVIDAMKWQNGTEIHYKFDYFPCDIKGELELESGKSYEFSLNSGGFIAIFNDEENFYLGCEEKWLMRYFLGIKLTEEEMEL